MFGRKKAASSPETSGGVATATAPGTALLLLREPVDLQADHVVAWWSHLWPEVPGPTNPVVSATPEGTSIAFDLPDGGMAGVGVMPVPVPGLGGGEEWTYLWPDFDASASGAHIVVFVSGQASPVASRSC